MRISIQGMTRTSARHPWRVIGAWIVLFAVGGFLTSKLLSSALTTQANFINNPESKQAQTLLEQRLTGPRHSQEIVIVRSDQATVDESPFRSYVEHLQTDIEALGPRIVRQSTDFYATHSPTLVSSDRHETLIPVTMAGSLDAAAKHIDRLLGVTLNAQHPAGFHVLVAGEATAGKDSKAISESDLKRGESIGVVFALIILVFVFGTLAAAVIPIVLALMSIVVALGLVSLLGLAFHFSFFVTNMITMMGLAVGIDYSLFVVSRYREERNRGRDKIDAIAMTGRTASRAVFFSGMTVVLALAGMLIIPSTVFASLATGAIAVVLVAVLASLTLLPAILGVMGDKVNSLKVPLVYRRRARDPEHTRGFWAREARAVMGRPVVSLTVAAGLLVVLALPLFGIRTGFAGVSTFPNDVQSKRAFTALARDFPGGLTEPAQIVVVGRVNSSPVRQGIERLRAALARDPAFGSSQVEANRAGNLALVSAPIKADPSSEPAFNVIRHLRADIIPEAFAGVPARVLVGGQTAGSVDFFSLTAHYTPIVLAFVLGLSFLLLMVVFRSVVVPALGVLLNLLSVGAAYGILVFVNQDGHGASLFGFQRVQTIEAWLPLFLFSVLFGLSMDYQVFLLSRIHERYSQTVDNLGAVSWGLRSTGGIITGAALIMVAVFGGFALGKLVFLQETGFGLAIAVLIDATIVRSILVPSGMTLLGKRNWYLPAWLKWLPRFRVEAGPGGADGVVVLPQELEPAG